MNSERHRMRIRSVPALLTLSSGISEVKSVKKCVVEELNRLQWVNLFIFLLLFS